MWPIPDPDFDLRLRNRPNRARYPLCSLQKLYVEAIIVGIKVVGTTVPTRLITMRSQPNCFEVVVVVVVVVVVIVDNVFVVVVVLNLMLLFRQHQRLIWGFL